MKRPLRIRLLAATAASLAAGLLGLLTYAIYRADLGSPFWLGVVHAYAAAALLIVLAVLWIVIYNLVKDLW